MNVLLLTTISGFLPKFLMQDVRILKELGCTVHYASNFEHPVYECDQKALEREGVICHSISIAKNPLALMANITALRQLNRLIRQYDIRAVHCHNPMGGVLGRLAYGKKSGGRSGRLYPYVIYTAHGFHFYKGAPLLNWLLFYPVERFLAHRTDQLITINHEDNAVADSFHLKKGGKTAMIPGVGYDRKRFRPRPEKRKEYRIGLGVREDDYLFLSVGELNDNKNHKTIIRAFCRLIELQQAGCGTTAAGVKLLICGEGKGRRLLERQIKKSGLEESVILCGYQTEIEKYYQCADCFLFPSIREGLGMAPIEAMACGLPVIAGDNRGSREYARENAICCKPMDVDAFAKAMQTVMEDPAGAAEMGRRSLKEASRFSIDKTGEIMLRIYERMVDEVYEQQKK